MLLGFWSGGPDICYDGDQWVGAAPAGWGGVPLPTPFKSYEYLTSWDGTTYNGSFFRDGQYMGAKTAAGAAGLNIGYSLSKYNQGTETGDSDVAEVLIYDHPLIGAQRVELEQYLNYKYLNLVTYPINFENALCSNWRFSYTQRYCGAHGTNLCG
jgi:hypothetical protein